MTNLLNYLWIILLALYILSPLDAHPLFLDDLIAAGALFYLLYKNAKQRKQRDYTYSYSQSQEQKKTVSNSSLSLEDAYRLLDVKPDASWKEIKKAYNEKIVKSHPDKVSHLSKELQEKAKELTIQLNHALDIIKKSSKMA